MKPFTLKTQTGIGLLEVLVTAVVIAVGLLAVAALQTGFLKSSGDNKIRSEALAIAERKLEELRNNITVTGYNALTAPSTSSDTFNGTNAFFTRSWAISDADAGIAGTDAPNRKRIAVSVSWDNNGDANTINRDEKVNVVTEIAFLDPAKSAIYAGEIGSGGSMAVPSPRQNASEDVASENVDATRPTPLPGTVNDVALVSGALPNSITVTGDNSTTYVLKPITTDTNPPTHYYSAAFGDGIIAIYLCIENANNTTATCEYIQNHFGGVPLRIAGTVYSTNLPTNRTTTNALADIFVAWSSSEIHYCYNGPKLQSTNYDYMPYECVFAGNCNATASAVPAAPSDPNDVTDPTTRCYIDSLVSDAQINNRHVGPGGEYGELGLIGVNDAVKQEQVCFLEDTSDPDDSSNPLLQASGSLVLNESYLYPVTKRSYVTRRIKRNSNNTGNEQTSEGINRSYTNHNFLVIKRGNYSSRSYEEQCHYYATNNYLVLAPRNIARALNESSQPNQVSAGMAYNFNSGTAKHLVGNISSNATNLKLYIPEMGACYLNNNLTPSTAATRYACAVPSNAPLSTGVSILGGSLQIPTSSPSVFETCAKTTSNMLDLSACAWPY